MRRVRALTLTLTAEPRAGWTSSPVAVPRGAFPARLAAPRTVLRRATLSMARRIRRSAQRNRPERDDASYPFGHDGKCSRVVLDSNYFRGAHWRLFSGALGLIHSSAGF